MTNEEQKLREIAEKWGIREVYYESTGTWSYVYDSMGCLSDLTALISENYVSKAEYDELKRQMNSLGEIFASTLERLSDDDDCDTDDD